MRAQQLPVIARFWMRRLFYSRHGVLFLVFFGLFHALTALWTVMLADNLGTMTDAAGVQDFSLVYEVVAKGIDLDRATIEAVLTSHPPLLVALYSVAIMAVPWLAIFATFDQTASDIATRHIRFLLIRTDRATLYAGRALGGLAFIAMAEAVGLAVLAITLASKGELGGLGGVVYLVRMWVCLVLYSAPFVALTAACGVLTGRPMWALACSMAFWFGVVIIAGLGSLATDSFSSLTYALPTEMKYHLISDDLSDLGGAFAHMAILTAAYFTIGYGYLRRRTL